MLVFFTRFTVTSAYQHKYLINQQPVCDFGKDVILCSRSIDMDLHLIKNVKSSVNKLDAVNKAYVDCIKYKTATGIIPNTV